ncbi:DUF899 family protein [Rhizobium gallicum]|uniref:DUF899 family protein n=1 Tax=Rhizobium gallicum TaxID=56730 RepID=UPI003AB0A97F
MIAARRETLGSSGESGNLAALGAADWLSLAAAPTFAVMALLTNVFGGTEMICSAASHTSPLTGMVPMYLLMSAFHLAPWLKLIPACEAEPVVPIRLSPRKAPTNRNHRDVTFTSVSRAPLAKIEAYKKRMGWEFPMGVVPRQRFQFRLSRFVHPGRDRQARGVLQLPTGPRDCWLRRGRDQRLLQGRARPGVSHPFLL